MIVEPFTNWNPEADSLPAMQDMAAVWSVSQVPAFENTIDTAVTNAAQGMTPVSQGNEGWSKWWQGFGQTVTGYLIAKDAKQSGVAAPVVVRPMPEAYTRPQQQQPGGLLVVALIVGAVVLARG
jgi:hypothetical protein